MTIKIGMFMIVLAVVSLALAPSLLINQTAEANKWCEDQKGKPHAWITGCKDGWYDHDNCLSYHPQSGDYAKGYKVGWDKGSC